MGIIVAKIVRSIILGLFIGIVINSYTFESFRFFEKFKQVDDEFKPYLDSIRHSRLVKPYNIGFVDQTSKLYQFIFGGIIIGSCNFVFSELTFEIDIHRDSWRLMNEEQKILLLAHELYHCTCLSFVHKNEKFDDGCAKHFMHEKQISWYCSKQYKDYYFDQIKRGCDA